VCPVCRQNRVEGRHRFRITEGGYARQEHISPLGNEGGPYAEFFHRDFFPSFPRSRLAVPEVEMHDGHWSLPDQPGLGVELDARTVEQALAAPITLIE